MVNYDGLYNKEFYGDKLNENHFSDKKLHFRIIENGTILPYKFIKGTSGFGGLVDEKGNFIKSSFVHLGIGDAYTPTDDVLKDSSTAIYIGMITNVWGHCLTDNIKRLWFLKSEVYKKNFSNCKIIYTSMQGGG